jgi:hypothetical protein
MSLVTRPPFTVSLPCEKFSTRIIVRSIDDDSYPECNGGASSGISRWFKINIWDIDEDSIEVYGICSGFMDSRGHWFIASTFDKPAAGARELKIV